MLHYFSALIAYYFFISTFHNEEFQRTCLVCWNLYPSPITLLRRALTRLRHFGMWPISKYR
jgi:hypothetical protein